MWSTGRSEPIEHPGLPVPVVVQPIRTARRLRLRYDERRQLLKLTCPARTSRKAALAWAAEQRSWVEQQIARRPAPEPLVPGAVIPVEGREVRLAWSESLPRTPTLGPGELRCGGPESSFPQRIERFLKRRALALLSRETAEFAEAAGVSAAAVSIGDADSRWGSCTSGRRIRYNWRLILAPPEARRFVAAHEVAHLVHLNHGPEFKALEARLYGGKVADARALLARVGPRLKRIGRGS